MNRSYLLMLAVLSSAAFFTSVSCKNGTVTASGTPLSLQTNTNTSTPTTLFTLTPSPTLTQTATPNHTATILGTASPTAPALEPTPTFTSLLTVTFTPTQLLTASPTATTTSLSGLTLTQTPVRTPTNCNTDTATFTSCATPTPTHPATITGSVTYTGSAAAGSGTAYIALYFYGVSPDLIPAPGGTYDLEGGSPGNSQLWVYLDYNGLWNITGYQVPLPGMRYYHGPTCSNPAAPVSILVDIPGGTTAGPSITMDDTCSFWGIYGTVTYTGIMTQVENCRQVHVQAYSDAAYTTPMAYSFSSKINGAFYYFVTNYGSNTTGLTPFYLRAYEDLETHNTITAGDPYVDLGEVTPTTNGLQMNISFGDANIY
jgi:hypothetical protein